MRRRTDEQAALAGRPGRWTDNDLRAALRVANEVHRPRRHSPIRAAIWNQRMHITEQQRDAFRDSVQRQLETARAEFAAAEERVMNHQAQARLQRTATTRALVEHGLLHFTSRHITPPLNSKKSAII